MAMAAPLIGLAGNIIGNILSSRAKKKTAAKNREEVQRAYEAAAKEYAGGSLKEEDLNKWLLGSSVGTLKQGNRQARSDIKTGLAGAQALLSPYSQAGQHSLGQTNFLSTGAKPPTENTGAFAPPPTFTDLPEYTAPPPPQAFVSPPLPQAPPPMPSPQQPQGPPNALHRSSGGAVDTVPAMLSNGEFVMSPEAVRHIGLERLTAMNDKFKKNSLSSGGSVKGYAAGGSVAAPVSPQPAQVPGVNRIPEYYAGLSTNMGEAYNNPGGPQQDIDKYNMDLYNRYNTTLERSGRLGTQMQAAAGGVPGQLNALAAPQAQPQVPQVGGGAPPVPPRPGVDKNPIPGSMVPERNVPNAMQAGGSMYGGNALPRFAVGGPVATPPATAPPPLPVTTPPPPAATPPPVTGPGAGRAYPSNWNVNGDPAYGPTSSTIAQAPAPVPAGFDVGKGGTRAQNQQVYGANYTPGNLPGFENIKTTADFAKLSPEQQGAYRALLYQQHSTAPGGGGASYEASPAYQWQLHEGEKGINRALSARGRSNSTFGLNTLSNFYRQSAAEEADKQYNREWQKTLLGARMAEAQSGQLYQGGNALAGQAYKSSTDLTNAFDTFAKQQGMNIDTNTIRNAANNWMRANGIIDANNMTGAASAAMWDYLAKLGGNFATAPRTPAAPRLPGSSESPSM